MKIHVSVVAVVAKAMFLKNLADNQIFSGQSDVLLGKSSTWLPPTFSRHLMGTGESGKNAMVPMCAVLGNPWVRLLD